MVHRPRPSRPEEEAHHGAQTETQSPYPRSRDRRGGGLCRRRRAQPRWPGRGSKRLGGRSHVRRPSRRRQPADGGVGAGGRHGRRLEEHRRRHRRGGAAGSRVLRAPPAAHRRSLAAGRPRHTAFHRRPHHGDDPGHERLRDVQRPRQRVAGHAGSCRATAARRRSGALRERQAGDHHRHEPLRRAHRARSREQLRRRREALRRPRRSAERVHLERGRHLPVRRPPGASAPLSRRGETPGRLPRRHRQHQPDARRAGPHRQRAADHRAAERPAQVAARDHDLRHAVDLPPREGHCRRPAPAIRPTRSPGPSCTPSRCSATAPASRASC